MRIFHNLLFIIETDPKQWAHLGYKTKLEDGRIINIKPIHLRKTEQKGRHMIIMSAEISLKYEPKVSKENIIFLPESDGRELGKALRFYANLISVTEGCKVGISSPTPSSGFIPENDSEIEFLEKTNGFEHKLYAQPAFTGDFFEAIYEDQLLDREEGVTFLATANSQSDSLGKFHEYIRLFENAFSASSVELAKLLFNFLSQYRDFDYTQDEIEKWMVETRDGATHADKRKKFVLSGDLNKDIDRIKQAAYDVLFNKKEWNNQDTTRRNLLQFKQGITREGMFVRMNKDEKDREIRITADGDAFYDPHSDLKEENVSEFVPPKEWWVKYVNTDGKSFVTESFALESK